MRIWFPPNRWIDVRIFYLFVCMPSFKLTILLLLCIVSIVRNKFRHPNHSLIRIQHQSKLHQVIIIYFQKKKNVGWNQPLKMSEITIRSRMSTMRRCCICCWTTIGQRNYLAQKMLQLCRMSSSIRFNIGMRWSRPWNPLPFMLR